MFSSSIYSSPLLLDSFSFSFTSLIRFFDCYFWLSISPLYIFYFLKTYFKIDIINGRVQSCLYRLISY